MHTAIRLRASIGQRWGTRALDEKLDLPHIEVVFVAEWAKLVAWLGYRHKRPSFHAPLVDALVVPGRSAEFANSLETIGSQFSGSFCRTL